MKIYYLRVLEVSSLIVPKSRCWQDYAFSWGFRGESIPCILWLPKSSSILWVLGHITPTSIPVIRFPSLPLLPPFYKDYYGYVGLTGIIQDNFPIISKNRKDSLFRNSKSRGFHPCWVTARGFTYSYSVSSDSSCLFPVIDNCVPYIIYYYGI